MTNNCYLFGMIITKCQSSKWLTNTLLPKVHWLNSLTCEKQLIYALVPRSVSCTSILLIASHGSRKLINKSMRSTIKIAIDANEYSKL